MSGSKMHEDEIDTDADLVRRLLAAQFPEWSDRAITRVDSFGTDHALYRLGDDLLARLPRIHWAVAQIGHEQQWLPYLAPHLPFAVAIPVAVGTPGEGYPYRWSVVRWFDGASPIAGERPDPIRLARDLATFVNALHAIDATGAPRSPRGERLYERDATTRAAIAEWQNEFDTDAMTAIWEAAVGTAPWSAPPVWIHGDITAGNLVCADGRLRAVIDFSPGVGDPAADMTPAWNLLPPQARDVFRATLDVDDATWTRGRGWALSTSVGVLPYYRHTNPRIVATCRPTIAAILADHG